MGFKWVQHAHDFASYPSDYPYLLATNSIYTFVGYFLVAVQFLVEQIPNFYVHCVFGNSESNLSPFTPDAHLTFHEQVGLRYSDLTGVRWQRICNPWRSWAGGWRKPMLFMFRTCGIDDGTYRCLQNMKYAANMFTFHVLWVWEGQTNLIPMRCPTPAHYGIHSPFECSNVPRHGK